MFRVIDCDEDLIYFQEDLDKLHQWSQRNQMDFNTKKCKIMRITRKQVPFTNSVHMNDTVLEEVKEFKDLGILTDCSLSWNSHTDMITAKANRMLGLIKRTCKDLKDTATLKTLFCSLVRSNAGERWKTTIGLISKKTTLHVQHTFLYISLPLFWTTTMWNSSVLLHGFWRKHVRVLVHFFFTAAHWWPLAFLILSPPLQSFHVVLHVELCWPAAYFLFFFVFPLLYILNLWTWQLIY